MVWHYLRSMLIAIDATTICDKDGGVGAGIEHYTWSITHSLIRLNSSNKFLILVPKEFSVIRRNQLIEDVEGVEFIEMFGPKIKFLSRHVILPLIFWFKKIDALFSPFGQIPLFFKGKSIITIHDVMIYTNPEWFNEDQKKEFSTRIVVPNSIKKADNIICVSNATKVALNNLFPETTEKSVVIYEGVSVPYSEEVNIANERFPFDKDYILFLGTIEPRKNLVNSFKAFNKFLDDHIEQVGNVRFIVAGKRGWKTEEVEDMLIQVNKRWSHIEPNGVIQFLGLVTEEEKWILLRRASVLMYTSFGEGFGLPVLEALSVGVPVISSKKGALEEIGGDVPIYTDPEDLEAISFAIAQCILLPEGVVNLRDHGYKHVKKFNWHDTAKKTLKIIEDTKNFP